MSEERITAVQSVANEVLDDPEIHRLISSELRRNLGDALMDKIEDGNAYIVTLGAERQEPEIWTNQMKVFRKIYYTKLIFCINCEHTPPVDIALVNDGTIMQLYCRRNRKCVHPLGFCAWAEERKEAKQ